MNMKLNPSGEAWHSQVQNVESSVLHKHNSVVPKKSKQGIVRGLQRDFSIVELGGTLDTGAVGAGLRENYD